LVRFWAFRRDVAAELKIPGLNAIDPSAYGPLADGAMFQVPDCALSRNNPEIDKTLGDEGGSEDLFSPSCLSDFPLGRTPLSARPFCGGQCIRYGLFPAAEAPLAALFDEKSDGLPATFGSLPASVITASPFE
jgi:hypothetical protein